MDELVYKELEYNLLRATKDTLIRLNMPLNYENFTNQLREELIYILENNDYRIFTRNNKARETMQNYNRIAILSYLYRKIAETEYVSADDVIKRYINNNEECVYRFIDKVAPLLVTNDLLVSEPLKYDDSIENGVGTTNFYTPSNECREAVMSGKQTSVTSSNYHIAGMNAYSAVGRRERQEDSYYIGVHPKNNNYKLMLVADGMGGHVNGHYASNFATKEIITWFEDMPLNVSDDEIVKALEDKVVEIDENLKKKFPSSGTTLCICIMKDDYLLMFNIGDSRGLVLEDNKLIYSTKTDNIANVLGIKEPFDRFHNLANHVTNCLGGEFSPGVNYDRINFKKNKQYHVILCTDGVTDCLSNSEVLEIMANSKNSNEAASSIVKTALSNKSSFKDEYNRYFGSLLGKIAYRKLYKALQAEKMNKDYDKVIVGGKDNTTAIVGHTVRH